MKKAIITILLCAVSTVSIAQLSFNNQNQNVGRFSSDIPTNIAQQLEQSAKYNGAIVGFGVRCNMPQSDIQKIENFYVRSLNRLNLDKNNLNVVFGFYNNAKQSVKTNVTSQECMHIRTEYDKIIKLIN